MDARRRMKLGLVMRGWASTPAALASGSEPRTMRRPDWGAVQVPREGGAVTLACNVARLLLSGQARGATRASPLGPIMYRPRTLCVCAGARVRVCLCSSSGRGRH